MHEGRGPRGEARCLRQRVLQPRDGCRSRALDGAGKAHGRWTKGRGVRRLITSEAAGLALVWLVAIALTAGKYDNALVYDDVGVIGTGTVIHDPANIPNVFAHRAMYAQGDVRVRALDTYRPVTLLSFFWDAAISGRDPISYHVTNTLLHLACIALVFRLARVLLPDAVRGYAAFAALFFAISPQLGEAHVWINGRSDLFCTLFGLGAILCWRRALAEPRAPRRHALQIGSFVLMLLGLLSKEVVIALIPLVVLWPAPGPASSQPLGTRLRQALPFLLAPLPYAFARASALRGLHASDPEELSRAVRHLPLLLVDGLRELLAPSRIYLRCLFDEYRSLGDMESLLALLALAALAALAVRYRRRAPLPGWCLLWYAATLAPAALVSTPTWAGFGRYLYLPAVGLAIGLTDLGARCLLSVRRRWQHPRANLAAGLALSIYFASLGLQLATVVFYYQDGETLYGAAYQARPDAAYSNEGLAAALLDAGQVQRAVPLFERAAALAPDNPRYVRKLFTAYMRAGRADRARALIEAALPRFPVELCGDLKALLIATTHRTDPERTIEVLVDCLRYQPELEACRRWIPILTGREHLHSARYRAALVGLGRALQ